jgi:hypothetical protein
MDARRILTPSTVACVILCMFLWVYVKPISAVLYTKWVLRNEPDVWVVPVPLSIAAPEQSVGRKFSYFGYEFETPWTELKRERNTESIVILNFANGDMVTMFAPRKDAGGLDAMKQEAVKQGRDIRDVFGDEATRSNYALQSKILNLTPRDLRLFATRQEMVGNSILLIMKKIWTGRIKGGLYSFQTEWLRGFQEGGVPKDRAVVIEAFDAQDQKIELFIGSEQGKDNVLSQADINRILYSLRPASVSPVN